VIVYYGVRKGQYHTIKMYEEVELQLHAFFNSAVNQGKSSASPPLLYPGASVGLRTVGQEMSPQRKASDNVGIRIPVVQPVS
jgi:hypothetical protein